MTTSGWQRATNLLCVRLDYLGDVLMMTPAIRALKRAHPDRHVTLLTSSCGAAIASLVPEIDDTIEYAAPWMKGSEAHTPEIDFAMIASLRARHFDGAVVFTTYSQSALPAAMLCYHAGIPLRLAHCRENPYFLLTDWVAETEPRERVRHEVRRQLDLVASIDCRTDDERLSLRVPAVELAWARSRLHALGIDAAQPWILLHPGASAPSRRYPPELWREAAQQLARRTGYPLIFTGAADEAALVEQIRQGVPAAHSLAGMLNLDRLAACIALARLAIANNTGPAHIAAAVGTPVVDLYALTNPQHTPWQVANRVLFHDVPCRFCYKSVCPQGHQHCLTKVEPHTVADAAIELLQMEDDHMPESVGVLAIQPDMNSLHVVAGDPIQWK
ncbi:lipopolysaccharide heptosyltransferase II [Noviherbaspirillum cavernae]|uniref:lipopolysaccharide heptosyltransferase II n=1 Tax=Noviherbaspirillum cavernae TaxID=2320862 RepID=A0A418X2M2_9BURK|nr:lipopolysaccharide heptosyltransferase II [Noviherbaspirillum cavernae]RJG06717.1 lipopolysaccharide heptosyltransferase II [Noviherbaspirillum cavernae]